MLASELLGCPPPHHCDGRLRLSLGKEHQLGRWLLMEVGRSQREGLPCCYDREHIPRTLL